ncbi:MAG: serine--tRNA ligase, partial [Actinobacteria bacterium]|nr:serine--tRNA ligase [Actinomycetota bacterium]
MIDLKAARTEPEAFRAALARKDAAEAFDELMAAHARWLELTKRVDPLRARLKLKGKPTPEQLENLAQAKEDLREVETALAAAEAEQQRLLRLVPNPPDPSAPDGFRDEDAEILRTHGLQPEFDFEPKDHLELGGPAGWVDMERAARVSGTRFAYRVGDVALL